MLLMSKRARVMWCSCLSSALRTALACAIVGCTALYGPASLSHGLAFPAYSYVTVLLIISNATLGDTMRSCWHALYGTVQGVGPAMLSLWMIGSDWFSTTTVSLTVGLSAFIVALPESTPLLSKRIALSQIVLSYLTTFTDGEGTKPFMHPVHLAVDTAVGAMACVLATLLPYPKLACCEAKQSCKQYAENAAERLKLFVKAFCAQDNAGALASISQAKNLAVSGTKLLQSIQRVKKSTVWEMPPIKPFKSFLYHISGDKLEKLEMPMKGMEIALTSTKFPQEILDENLKHCVSGLERHIFLRLNQMKSPPFVNSSSGTVPESNVENMTAHINCLTNKNLSSLFFLFCLKLLHRKAVTSPPNPTSSTEKLNDPQKQEEVSFKTVLNNLIGNKKLMRAFKCSLSLGLSVLFGLIYNKENGFWSGLTVAITLATGREATFRLANVRAQGTVLGSVYGVIGCFVFQRLLNTRFLSLFPWFIITSFLQQSRMYGPAGATAAVIGAIQILGRKNYGPPSEFAIVRIIEVFIGLSCSIIVEILLQPTRASTLAKIQLSKSLGTLYECIGSISLETGKDNFLEDKQKKLKMAVNELKQFVGEAEVEPNFWFLPFCGAAYKKLLVSLSKDMGKYLDGDVELFKETVGSLIKCFEDVILVKSLEALNKELQKNSISCDLEIGKSSSVLNGQRNSVSGEDEVEVKKIVSSFVVHAKEVVDKVSAVEGGDEKEQGQLVQCLGAIGFCMSDLIKETREIEQGIKELVQWENPSLHINLYDISHKLSSLYH
ncbi:hypothetical protein RJ641_008660 [Dillenia turbinata]|uniref:Integral membrane bound transporter domain-containing protein n=1 Tax=Dillenia turbinata TaxID=194707 RepID=A0AAN8Z6Q1_9MAGN